MAFNYSGSNFVSFAVYADVVQRDARLFEANEGLTSAMVTDLLTLSSQRILSKIKNTDWWRDYNFERNSSLNNDVRNIPAVNPDNIDAAQQDFKDLNIYLCLSDYILPKIADFGNPTSAEIEKIKFYRDAYNALFLEVIEAGDWYDYSGTGTITTDEKKPVKLNLVRIR